MNKGIQLELIDTKDMEIVKGSIWTHKEYNTTFEIIGTANNLTEGEIVIYKHINSINWAYKSLDNFLKIFKPM